MGEVLDFVEVFWCIVGVFVDLFVEVYVGDFLVVFNVDVDQVGIELNYIGLLSGVVVFFILYLDFGEQFGVGEVFDIGYVVVIIGGLQVYEIEFGLVQEVGCIEIGWDVGYVGGC